MTLAPLATDPPCTSRALPLCLAVMRSLGGFCWVCFSLRSSCSAALTDRREPTIASASASVNNWRVITYPPYLLILWVSRAIRFESHQGWKNQAGVEGIYRGALAINCGH